MKFSEIPGHDEVKTQLRSLVDSGHMPHALLLQGPAGVGKMMLARALAQYIHCTNRTGGDSCGVCPACRQHQTFNHIDTHYTFPIVKKQGSSGGSVICDDYMDSWREFLTDSPYMNLNQWVELLGNANAQPTIYVAESSDLMHKLSFTAHASRYKIALIWLPERMQDETANKLLKIIEEPHDDTIFILVSNTPAKILPTIYSRLQRIEVKRLPDDIVADYLIRNLAVDPTMAASVAHISNGSILEAQRRLSNNDESTLFFDKFVQLMRLAYQRKVIDLRSWGEDVAAMGREKACRFMEYCERLTGENYIFNLRDPRLVSLDDSEQAFSTNFARFINERNVMQLRQLFVEGRRDIQGNANAKIVAFDIAVRVILLLKA